MSEWYVLHVRTGAERDVRAELARKHVTAYVPEELRQERRGGEWHGVPRVLMPGYVFVVIMELDLYLYHRIKTIPGVIRFLGGKGAPEPLHSEEAAYIRWLANDGAYLPPSQVTIAPDGTAHIGAGPLCRGPGAANAKIDRHARRATVTIPIAGRPHKVTLSITTLKATD